MFDYADGGINSKSFTLTKNGRFCIDNMLQECHEGEGIVDVEGKESVIYQNPR